MYKWGGEYFIVLNNKTAVVPPYKTLPPVSLPHPPAGAARRAAVSSDRGLAYCGQRFSNCVLHNNTCNHDGRCRTYQCRCWPCSRIPGAGSCLYPMQDGTRQSVPARCGQCSGRGQCRMVISLFVQRRFPAQGDVYSQYRPTAGPVS